MVLMIAEGIVIGMLITVARALRTAWQGARRILEQQQAMQQEQQNMLDRIGRLGIPPTLPYSTYRRLT